MNIAEHVQQVRDRINAYEKKYARPPGSVFLLAVSKGQSIEKIRAGISAGLNTFGENYVQEAKDKIAQLATEPIEWHFIGHIQSNKTQQIAKYFSWVHSLNNEKSAQRLNDQRSPLLPRLNVLIEVNVYQEQSKSGVMPDQVKSLLRFCQQLPRLHVRGLMAMPPLQKDFAKQRLAFHELYKLYRDLQAHGFNLDTISAGTSEDFEAAIAEGSTLVRLGTVLFGARLKR